jgi:DNA (cytosine-5)-methyltransferase 1
LHLHDRGLIDAIEERQLVSILPPPVPDGYPPTDLTAVSLFAGVGGIDLALQRAGVNVTAAVEIDNAARGVLADRFPETTLFPDVTKVTPDELLATGFDPARGVLAGGFPCQDLSVAGRRKGLGGSRSGLFWDIVRLADALHPRWLLLENVPGLLSAVCPCVGDESCQDAGHDWPCGEWRKERGVKQFFPNEPHNVAGGACVGGCLRVHGGAMGAVLGALGELGYGFAYRVLDAEFFGVPQRRDRVFIVGRLGDARGPVEVLLEPESSGRDHPTRSEARARVAATLTAGTSRPGVSAPGRRQEDDTNLVVAALTANGVGTCGADDNQARAGHVVVAQPVSAAGNSIAATLTACGGPEGGRVDKIPAVCITGDTAHTLTAEGHDASEDGTGRGTPVIATAPAVRRLTPMECERLQGFPDGHTLTSNGKPQADSARYRQMGNAVAVPVVEWIARRMVAVA